MHVCVYVIIHVGVTEACPAPPRCLPALRRTWSLVSGCCALTALCSSHLSCYLARLPRAATCTPAVATMPPLLLLLCLALVTGDQPTTGTTTRHHEDDEINAKMERYVALLRRRRDAIDKFLADNYSDFNHSDYTPEVRQLLAA